jgi:hypothetical protein
VATHGGKHIVVYSDSVGDVNTPAEPRLVELDMAADGGSGIYRTLSAKSWAHRRTVTRANSSATR